MFNWRNRSVDLIGAVFFRGTIPPRADDFAFLREQGVRLGEVPADNENLTWCLRAAHNAWGEAEIFCPRGLPPPARVLINFDRNLTSDERETAAGGQTAVMVRVRGSRQDVLRDRKSLLRWLRAVMADDGVVALDHLAQRLWSRGALDDELVHDADVDIAALFTLHAVGSEDGERAEWLHTHGLAELGFFDFDILNPSDALADTAADALRAIAFAIVEGEVTRSTPRWQLAYPKGFVRFVDVADFNRRASAELKAMRGPDRGGDNDHNRDRAILCEPGGGLLGRLFGGGGDKLRPSKFLSSGFDEEGMFALSPAASTLSEQRAKHTYPLFRKLADELKEFDLPMLAKIGYAMDNAPEGEREYLWFEVHETFDDAIDGTLANEPFHVARLKAGQRGRHAIENLNDWVIMTPIGMINPRSTQPAREIRAHPDEFRAAVAEMKAAAAAAGREEK